MPAAANPFASPSTSNATAMIAALAAPQDIRSLPMAGVQVISAARLCAVAERDGLDPSPELARRHRSFETAFALHDLIRTVTRTWPEPFMVGRPCCLHMTPDEATLAAMVRHARRRDRDGFERSIDGFVRASRHDALWNACLHAVALLG